jgi:50S ribosomal protein L16 3-hydroxylase
MTLRPSFSDSANGAAHDPNQPLALLGGLTPQQFMKRYWHKKPLLVRQAVPQMQPLLSRAELFGLAGQESVESRLLVRKGEQDWALKQGPFQKRQLPPVSQAAWTLLVQGVDLHHDAVHQLMNRFRFVPDARLDDLMISWASDQGGVGPHYDSYDVFLLQAHGKRHWRIGRQNDLSLIDGLPLKILASFEPEEEWVLEPGDMLYLPPQWAHDGVALGADCMTYSIGFRAPQRGALAAELALRMGEHVEDEQLYRDPKQEAVGAPAEMPQGLVAFAEEGMRALLADRQSLAISLGEILTEPKPKVWFEENLSDWTQGAVRLDRKTRMLYDDHHVFINGESLQVRGKDAKLLRDLANQRGLSAAQVGRASPDLQEALSEWFVAGWLHRVG